MIPPGYVDPIQQRLRGGSVYIAFRLGRNQRHQDGGCQDMYWDLHIQVDV